MVIRGIIPDWLISYNFDSARQKVRQRLRNQPLGRQTTAFLGEEDAWPASDMPEGWPPSDGTTLASRKA